jgi:hypothetical protein
MFKPLMFSSKIIPLGIKDNDPQNCGRNVPLKLFSKKLSTGAKPPLQAK